MSLPGNTRPAVRLWRVEHEELLVGPFNAEVTGHSPLTNWAITIGLGADEQWRPSPGRMPTILKDVVLRPRGDIWDWLSGRNFRFAFSTLDQLRSVFCGWAIHRLARSGWVLRTFSVPWAHHLRARQQAIFDVRHARVLNTYPLTAAFWL